MWNLKNKKEGTNKIQRLIDTENKLRLPDGRGVEGLGKEGAAIKNKLVGRKKNSVDNRGSVHLSVTKSTL